MGRGICSGGGQSSLGYLFGSGDGEDPKPTSNNSNTAPIPAPGPVNNAEPIPAGVPRSVTNNYFRADGQNNGNFITDRPSTKVHAAPGGGSSLGYLFGDVKDK